MWKAYKRASEDFPYLIIVKENENIVFELYTKDLWPGNKGNIFCIRKTENLEENLVEVENVNILSLKRYGRRVSIILDREKRKRCDFIFIKKPYKNKDGEYEQIFFRTQTGIHENKPKIRLSTSYVKGLKIIIDSLERYPWTFNRCEVEKEKLPVGDYALKGENGMLAVIERKTFDNFKNDISILTELHQKLGELTTYKYSALVLEAKYSDFFKPNKILFYSSVFIERIFAEISAFHPKLNIVFAENRKLANRWAERFFEAVYSQEKDKIIIPQVNDAILKYEHNEKKMDYIGIKDTVKKNLPPFFTIYDLKVKFPNIDTKTIRKILNDFKRNGIIKNVGRGSYQVENQENLKNTNF